ncbi:hypothetical protein P152DRAFT_480091 [Eremomyces bilateralis CBS 781.70]|uniref:Uncharacterized protein n=1 Tax=Eremomyces bilateralis CBS 781.70 TaxID=1392243 RepID=A0A6G1GA72_9PEZI|nr:uncharacterized protein P152DRAFT_480091 [Eremomyces bilateralis CBS 781.70]KAF1814978.1 hypothetical protein P152DRAFT_480091 [Eremomyces bilateralis CBS 781.70]
MPRNCNSKRRARNRRSRKPNRTQRNTWPSDTSNADIDSHMSDSPYGHHRPDAPLRSPLKNTKSDHGVGSLHSLKKPKRTSLSGTPSDPHRPPRHVRPGFDPEAARIVNDARVAFHVRRELGDLLAHASAVKEATGSVLREVASIESAAMALQGGLLSLTDMIAAKTPTMDWEPCAVKEYIATHEIPTPVSMGGNGEGEEQTKAQGLPETMHHGDLREEMQHEEQPQEKNIAPSVNSDSDFIL